MSTVDELSMDRRPKVKVYAKGLGKAKPDIVIITVGAMSIVPSIPEL
jgi:hypothetical protein